MDQKLTRRPYKNPHHQGGWNIFYGDIRVGHIGKRAGVPVDVDQWGWNCGFYPGCDPGQSTSGSAETFELARAGFEEDWKRLLATRSEAHFEACPRSRDFHAWKYRMSDERCRMPTQNTTGQSKCFCGAEITIRSTDEHVLTEHRGIGDEHRHEF
jgi:hypothetical protein